MRRAPGSSAPKVPLDASIGADLILSFMFGLGGLFAVIYGAAIAGSERTWGTLKTSVVRGESRSRYLFTTFAAIAVVLAAGSSSRSSSGWRRRPCERAEITG